MRGGLYVVIGLLLGLCGCLELGLWADLDGPQVTASTLIGPRTVQVPVLPRLVLEFSEPVDPASLHVALVPWEEHGHCDLSPKCAEPNSQCERGRCLRDKLTAAKIRRLMSGPLDDSVALQPPELADSAEFADARVTISPVRALQPRTRYSLLVFVRDRSGAPLVDANGEVIVWHRDLVTAEEGSAGPEARLVSPVSGTIGVPPNIGYIDTEFVRPVVITPDASLELQIVDGPTLALVAPRPCPGWVPGLCLRWPLPGLLPPATAYELAAGELRDGLGRPAVPAHRLAWFVTADAPDTTPPPLTAVTAWLRGPCVYVAWTAEEPLQVQLLWQDASDVAIVAPGQVHLGVRVDATTRGATTTEVTVIAEDLAGNRSVRSIVATRADAAWSEAPDLGLSEVLANPAGAEPRQEFIELVDLRSSGPALIHTDLYLTDLSATDLAAAIADGTTPGDALPPLTTTPGELVLIVAAGYDPFDPADPDPLPATQLVRVDASLAAGGLKNAGEPITLYRPVAAGEVAVVASYSNFVATGAPAHNGRSVIADPTACDVPRAWRLHPTGTSSPGWLP